MPELHLSGDAAADKLLSNDSFALLTGMLLDQQIAMEVAFAGPEKIRERIGSIEPATIAGYDAEKFKAAFAEKPAVHRYPGSMAGRVQQLATAIVEGWDGDTAAIWTSGSPNGREVLKRLKALPGFGDQKARIFLALLGKQLGFEGEGWREAAGPYGEEGSRKSVADIVDRASLLEVRATKQAAKAATKAKK